MIAYIPPSLLIALILSILFVIGIPLVRGTLDDATPAILVNVSFAIIASFVFYTIVDVSRRMREHDAAAPYISRQIETMRGDVLAVCQEADRTSGHDLPAKWEFSRDAVAVIFTNAHILSPVNMILLNGKQATLLDYLIDRATRTTTSLEHLLIFSSMLGGEATAQIAEIQWDIYLMQIQTLFQFHDRMTNQDLSFMIGEIDDHYQRIIQLERWATDNQLMVSQQER